MTGQQNEFVHDVEQELASAGALEFLANLGSELTLTGRSVYPKPDIRDEAMDRLIGHNELLELVVKQIRTLLSQGDSGYPSKVFAQVLIEKSRKFGVELELATALSRALDLTRRQSRWSPCNDS